MLQSIRHEFVIMCSISTCPKIIRVFGIVTKIKGQISIIMEYASNGSLRKYLNKNNELSKVFVHNTIYDIAFAMEVLHENKIYHRDLKSDNVLLDGKLHAKVCDFGLSKAKKLMTTSSGGGRSSTSVGTPAFKSPEEFRSKKKQKNKYDEAKCDVYAFGITMWEIITCQKPWEEEEDDIYGLMDAVRDGDRPEYDKNKKIEQYGQLCIDTMEHCWKQDPNDRPTFALVVDAIKSFQRVSNDENESVIHHGRKKSVND